MTSLDAELAALHPRGEAPLIPARRPRWRFWFVVPLALAGLWTGVTQPGSVPAPDTAGYWGEYLVPPDSVREQCGNYQDDGFDSLRSPGEVVFSGSGPESACIVGLTRRSVKPPPTLPPEDPAKACAGLAGMASLDGWTPRFGEVASSMEGTETWNGLFTSRNGWLLACQISASRGQVWFGFEPDTGVIISEGLEEDSEFPDDPGPTAPRRGQRRSYGIVGGFGRLSEVPEDVAARAATLVVTEQSSPGEVRLSVQGGYLFGAGQLFRRASRFHTAGRYTARLLDAEGNELFSWTPSS